jgi:hypothetical protein
VSSSLPSCLVPGTAGARLKRFAKGKGKKKKAATTATPATPVAQEPTDRHLLLELTSIIKGFGSRLARVEGSKAAPSTPPAARASSSDSEAYDQDNEPTPVKHHTAAAAPPRRRKLKSGRVRTANSYVKTVTTWPHEVVYDEANEAQEFDKLTITQFVKGFCKVTRTRDMERAEIRTIVLEEIMEDAETHPWELIRAAHAILLQQIESGRASWEDHLNREAIRRSHIH